MNVAQKRDLAAANLVNIAEHRDTDAAVRKAAIEQVIAIANAQMENIDAEIAAEIAAM